LLCFDFRERLTASQALEHPFFADVRDPSAEQKHEVVQLDFEGKLSFLFCLLDLRLHFVFLFVKVKTLICKP
jgi:hypothetical protein